jgi:putative DNA primase/helicase
VVFRFLRRGPLGNFFIEAVFRAIEEKQPTLLIDEADTFLQGNDELRGILNSGYTRKTAFVVRVGPEGKSTSPRPSDSVVPTPSARGGPSTAANSFRRFPADGSPPAERGRSREGEVTSISESRLVRFSCWCPKVMAAIGHLPETLGDRCIVIRMQRKTSSEECEKLRNLDGSILRRKCARFVKARGMEIASARPALPLELNDRAGDVWEPLLPLFCTPFSPRISFFYGLTPPMFGKKYADKKLVAVTFVSPSVRSCQGCIALPFHWQWSVRWSRGQQSRWR